MDKKQRHANLLQLMTTNYYIYSCHSFIIFNIFFGHLLDIFIILKKISLFLFFQRCLLELNFYGFPWVKILNI